MMIRESMIITQDGFRKKKQKQKHNLLRLWPWAIWRSRSAQSSVSTLARINRKVHRVGRHTFTVLPSEPSFTEGRTKTQHGELWIWKKICTYHEEDRRVDSRVSMNSVNIYEIDKRNDLHFCLLYVSNN